MSGLLRLRVAVTSALFVVLLASTAVWPQSDAEALLRRADADARAGRFDAAREGYIAALRAGASLDQDATRSQLLAASYANSSPVDLASAVRWYRNALRLTGDERVRAELADTLVRAGQYDAAAEQYEVLSNAHPGSTVYIIALGRAWLQAGRADDALQAVDGWLSRTPNSTAVRLEYARILSYQKHFQKARAQYETVLNAEPTNLIAQIGVAKVISWQGDQETALPMYERILARNPTNYDALVGKAFSLLWMGRQAEAIPLLQTAARRNPNDADVREALAHLRGTLPMPEVAAAPPSLPDVPAAAPFAQGATAPPINVPPPTVLPQITPAQRAAGATAFVPGLGPAPPEPSARKRAKSAGRKAAAKEEPKAPPPEELDSKPETTTSTFDFRSMSKNTIALIVTGVIVFLIIIYMVTSRDKAAVDDWHDKPRPLAEPARAALPTPRAKPVQRATVPSPPPRPASPPPVASAAQLEESYTLSGVPRSGAAESAPWSASAASPQKTPRPSPPPQPALRPTPSPPAARPVFVTEMMPRAVQLRLDGLRILLVGSEPAVIEVERHALEAAGADVLIESNWNNAIARMTSEGVHGIVLNEDSSGQTRHIYQSLAQQYPGWMRRLLLVLAKDDILTIQFMSSCQAKCLLRPFQSAELLTIIAKMFGMNAESAGAGS